MYLQLLWYLLLLLFPPFTASISHDFFIRKICWLNMNFKINAPRLLLLMTIWYWTRKNKKLYSKLDCYIFPIKPQESGSDARVMGYNPL